MSINKKIFVSTLVAAFVLTVASASAAYVHTVTLKLGSKSAQVMALQQTLNMTSCKVATSGAGAPGFETSTFGPKTKAAVMCFQASHGLAADGIVGVNTGTALQAVTGTTTGGTTGGTVVCPAGYVCQPTGGTTGGSVSLSGSNGTIDSVDKISTYNNEDVGEGENDVKVAGFEVQTSNDGDIQLKSVKLVFDPTGNGSGDSDHLDDYIDGVTIWMGDEEVGSASVDDFTQNDDDTYSKVISLDSSAVVKSDDSEKFYISVDAANNLDSGDIDSDSWTVGIENIRYIDGSGVTTTDDSSFSTGAGNIGWDSTNDGVGMDFVDFGTAADTELKISTNTSTNPDAGIVMVDDQDTTDNVLLLAGKLKLDGTSDVTIDSFPVTLSTSGATDLDEVTGSLTLVLDGNEYNESVNTSVAATTTTVTFDNLDFSMNAGDTVNFEIRADINDIETGTFEEGDSLKADITASNRSAMDVENEQGDQLDTSSERSGTASGEYQEFRTEGIAVSVVGTPTATVTAGTSNFDDTGTFTIKFKVTAVGSDVYLATTVANELTYVVDDSGTATTGGVSAVIVDNTDSDLTAAYNWLIEEGDSETFTVTIVRSNPPSDAGLYRASITGIKWDTDDDQTPDNTYTSNLDDLKTDYISLN